MKSREYDGDMLSCDTWIHGVRQAAKWHCVVIFLVISAGTFQFSLPSEMNCLKKK